MGEYAKRKSDGIEIKIGTCESMYYIRWCDRLKVTALPHSLDPATCPNLYWRLPVPSEDGIQPGDYVGTEGAVLLMPCEMEDDKFEFYEPQGQVNPGTFQMHHNSGLLLNIKCYHGAQLPDGSDDIKPHWNGKAAHVWELCGVKNHELADGSQCLLPLVRCKHCGQMIRETWAGVLPHIRDQALRDKLTEYAIVGPFEVAQPVAA